MMKLFRRRTGHSIGSYTAIDMVPCGSFSGDEAVLLRLVQVVPDRPVGIWIVDTVPVLLIEISGCNLLVILDNLVDCSLMRRQRLDILLSQLLPSFRNRTLDYACCDLFYAFLLGVTSGDTKRRNRHASVAAGGIRDEFEFRLFDGIRDECVLRPFLQDVDKLVK